MLLTDGWTNRPYLHLIRIGPMMVFGYFIFRFQYWYEFWRFSISLPLLNSKLLDARGAAYRSGILIDVQRCLYMGVFISLKLWNPYFIPLKIRFFAFNIWNPLFPLKIKSLDVLGGTIFYLGYISLSLKCSKRRTWFIMLGLLVKKNRWCKNDQKSGQN